MLHTLHQPSYTHWTVQLLGEVRLDQKCTLKGEKTRRKCFTTLYFSLYYFCMHYPIISKQRNSAHNLQCDLFLLNETKMQIRFVCGSAARHVMGASTLHQTKTKKEKSKCLVFSDNKNGCLSVQLSPVLSVWLPFFLYKWLSYCMSVCLSVCLPACPMCLPVCLTVTYI